VALPEASSETPVEAVTVNGSICCAHSNWSPLGATRKRDLLLRCAHRGEPDRFNPP
jgi:hypothetical protein